MTRVGQNARLTFDGTAGQRVSVGMNGITLVVGYCCDVGSVAIYKPDGTALLSPFGFHNNGNGTPRQTLPVTRTYSIPVYPNYSSSCKQTVTLSEFFFFFFNDTATSEIFTLSLRDALPISFDGTAGQRVSVGMDGITLGVGYCCDVGSVAIYKPDGTVLLSPFAFPNGGNGTPSQVLPVTGTYSIMIDPYAARTGNVTVTLSEEHTPAINTNNSSVAMTFHA